ncbi:MAG: MBL fold metallo-hydrolase [Prevotella sp.]|nr:MBL fold metallo-hydrolase [Prevotella sp.]
MKKTLRTILLSLGLMMAVGATAAQKSDTFETPGGKTVVIHHIKHASIHIEYGGRHIYVDPVGTGLEPKTDVSLLPKANIILLTHEHFDHYDPMALPQMYLPATAVYANPTVVRKANRGIAMNNGDSIIFAPDIKIYAVPAYNTTPGREEYHPKGRDNGYVLELDGLRIYIAGDTEDVPEMADLKDIDIAFLPCNQPYTMTVDQLVKAANVIEPKVLFPYHYSETPINQVRIKMAGSGIDVRIRDYK